MNVLRLIDKNISSKLNRTSKAAMNKRKKIYKGVYKKKGNNETQYKWGKVYPYDDYFKSHGNVAKESIPFKRKVHRMKQIDEKKAIVEKKHLFKPSNRIKEAGSLQWMLVAVVGLFLSNVLIWWDDDLFKAEEKTTTFSHLMHSENHLITLRDILFGACLGYFVYYVSKALISAPLPDFKVKKIKHKVSKRESADHRLRLKIYRYFNSLFG